MKRVLQFFGLLVLLGVLSFAAFFFWAKSGTLGAGDYTAVDARSQPVEASDTLTVMTYNIGYLSGMTNNEPIQRPRSLYSQNMQGALQLIRDVNPDLVGLQEIDFGARRSYNADQLDTLATDLDYPISARVVNWDVRYLPFPGSLLDTDAHFGKTVSGQALLSRLPIDAHQRLELTRTSRPYHEDVFYLDRLAQVAVVKVGDWPLVVINVHLEAFEEATRERQAEQLRALYDAYAESSNLPILVIGDFNSRLPAEVAQLSTDEAADAAGDQTMTTLLDGTDLQTAFPDSAYAAQRLGTYPADAPTRKIDHILYRAGTLERLDAGVRCGESARPPSDHCAVWMQFHFPRPDSLPVPSVPAPAMLPDASSR